MTNLSKVPSVAYRAESSRSRAQRVRALRSGLLRPLRPREHPPERPPAEDVQVEVRDLLPAVPAGVRDQPPAPPEALRARDAGRDREQASAERLVVEVVERGDVLARDDQHVRR